MASGRTHDWTTLGLLVPVALVCRYLLHWSWPDALALTGGTWAGGLLLSPDLDTKSRPFFRWGLFRFIWLPYQWLARHRSPLSHGWLLAAWLRLIYLSAVLVLVYFGAYLALSHLAGLHGSPAVPRTAVLRFVNAHLNVLLLLGLGIWLGSLLHILLDFLSDVRKGRRRSGV